jgi:hypothetical protein
MIGKTDAGFRRHDNKTGSFAGWVKPGKATGFRTATQPAQKQMLT